MVDLEEKFWKVLLNKFQITSLTPVQKKCIPAFNSKVDVIVQSPTGSGKTLAYVIPLLRILSQAKSKWKKWEIGCLILVPNRELARQVSQVVESFLSENPFSVVSFVGGNKTSQDIQHFKEHGGNIVIGTPGRVEDLLNQTLDPSFSLRGHLKALEVLILDEADRLLEMGFDKSISDILSSLPKQRRNGLFSATQVTEMEDLVRTSLRNPLRIEISGEEAENILPSTSEANPDGGDMAHVTPFRLKNYYLELSAESKITGLVEFLRQHRKEKILVFVSSCACVDYLNRILTHLLKKDKVKILSLHGKKRKRRQSLLDNYTGLNAGVMVCTDIMARGIDVPDVDWVVQFDPPRKTTWFIHRSGRSARCGRAGNALILLVPNEEGYVEFLETQQKISLQPYMELASITPEAARATMDRLREIASKDRDFLESGTRAYVSYIQAYSKHDCHLVCNIRELDVVGMAHSFGLLRLPKMPELNGRDLGSFQRTSLNTSDIQYSEKGKEMKRQVELEKRRTEAEEKKKRKLERETREADGKRGRRKRMLVRRDVDEIDDDYKLLRKFRKGQISKEHFDSQFN